MDGQRFDELARLVATGVPRRRVLGMIAGGIAALGARITSTGATIACIPENETCGLQGAGTPTECCPAFECVDNVCVPLQPICIPEGESCGVQSDGDIPSGCCEGLECVDGTCVPIQPICADIGEACSDLAGANPSCCHSLVCVQGFCEPVICVGVGEACSDLAGFDPPCCLDLICAQGVCEEPVPICSEPGAACGGKGDLECCEGLDCFEGTCFVPPNGCTDEGEACELDDNCCAGICCAGFCRDIECCIDEPNPNDRCDDGQTCFEGVCEGVVEVCESDDDCDDDTCCCDDGGCDEDCCEEPVTQLPSTGTGQADKVSTGLFATAAAAAAAFLAGRKLRETSDETEPTT